MATTKNESPSTAQPTTETASTHATAPDAAPQVIGDAKEHLYVSPHEMTTDIDPAYAGDYELTHGQVRLGDKVYRAGAKLRLGSIDAYRFLESGVVKRIDGKRPDRTENSSAAQDLVAKQHRDEAERENAKGRAA